jgi:hypothetical protein
LRCIQRLAAAAVVESVSQVGGSGFCEQHGVSKDLFTGRVG